MSELAIFDAGYFSRGFGERFTAAIQQFCEPDNQDCTFREALDHLADQMGVSVSTVIQWTYGMFIPSVYNLQVFCWQTDISVVWMLYGDDLQPRPLEKEASINNHPLSKSKK